jgi:hypothetical protein
MHTLARSTQRRSAMSGLFVAVALAAGLAGACGARTNIDLEGNDSADASLDSARDSGRDSARDARLDAAPDAPIVVTPVECRTDADCDDGIGCTRDLCDPQIGRCTRTLDDQKCDDGVFCTGTETCKLDVGCVQTPRACTSQVSCGSGLCNKQKDACEFTFDDARCPISYTCDPVLGCQARALAIDVDSLYEVRLPSGIVNRLAATGGGFTDIALSPSNTLLGCVSRGLYSLNTQNGTSTFIAALTGSFNALDFAPNGTLYGAGGSTLYRISPLTGQQTRVAGFPAGFDSSGDIVFINGRALASASGASNDSLVEFDLVAGTSRLLGTLGYRCVYGLAAFGATLYGLTCEGRVLSVNPMTGASTQLNQVNTVFYGATAR